MDTETGRIRELTADVTPGPTEKVITEKEAAKLMKLPASARPTAYKHMRYERRRNLNPRRYPRSILPKKCRG